MTGNFYFKKKIRPHNLLLSRILWCFRLLFLMFLSSTAVYAQEMSVTGKVTSSENGEPLPGVNVVELGTTNGSVTDLNGVFSINVSQEATLVFSMIGFKNQEVAVGNRTVINITLSPDTKQLDELVVIGYGTQSRRTLTTSVANLDGEVLEKIPISNVGEGLKGKISGARVYSNNTTPGADPVIRIRGGSSINKSNAR